MRLNVQTDYALRMLMYLAANPEELVTIADIAQRFGISRNHLMKVANVLGREGFVNTVRGRSGGLVLGREVGDIRIGDVVRAVESDFVLVQCFGTGNGNCLISRVCKLHGILQEALDAFLDVLDRYTLQDLMARNDKLGEMLMELSGQN